METPVNKKRRIDARVPHAVYVTLCRAAELTGTTVSQFLAQAALKEAWSVIEREEVMRLSSRDWNWMLALVDDPPKPNRKLQAAMNRHAR